MTGVPSAPTRCCTSREDPIGWTVVTTASAPRVTARARPSSTKSPTCSVTPSSAGALPGRRTTARTCADRSTSARHTAAPTSPFAPVTTTTGGEAATPSTLPATAGRRPPPRRTGRLRHAGLGPADPPAGLPCSVAPPPGWPALPHDEWQPTCDTLHAHTQVLGKLSVALAPPQPQLQHGALRLSARGWETGLLPAPDGSGALVVVLDLHTHEAIVEHTDGRQRPVALTPHRSVGAVTRDVLAAVRELAGPVAFNPRPQETPWSTPLDQDDEHATYDPEQVGAYLAAAGRAAVVLAALRAPYRGRVTPVNAWWGSFDLAVSLFSGRPADPPSDDFIMRNAMDAQEITVGWWPGDQRYPRAAFYGYVHPAPPGYPDARLDPPAARWQPALGEFVLDWDDVRGAEDPHATSMRFARAVARHSCTTCAWDPALAAPLDGTPPPDR